MRQAMKRCETLHEDVAAGLSTQIIPAASSHFSAAVTVDCVFRFLLSLCEYLRCFDISTNIKNILFMPSRSSTSCTEGVNFFSTYKTQISHVFGYKMLKHTHIQRCHTGCQRETRER